MKELLDKIKERGYWKIIIRPTNYFEDMIESTDVAEELIKKYKVRLRGWDYPHIDSSGIQLASTNSISSFCDWPQGPMFEYWRFYQTGQFVHYLALREDLRIDAAKIKEFQEECGVQSERFLSVLNTIYTITEIFEFSRRLFGELDKAEGAEIIVELHNANDRTVVFWDTFGRWLAGAYTCRFPEGVVPARKVVDKKALLTNSNELALDVAFDIFKAFNWKNPNRDIFREDQNKFLERRL